MSLSQPLISFVVPAYKQEKYVEEAIRGAFSQTYSPLEIVLSDDASPDRTFELMKSAAENYSGPHRIILNRNERNLGIGGHVNRVIALSRGEIIVLAAGDDISAPDRVQAIHDAWRESGGKATSFMSDFETIDASGHPLKEAINRRFPKENLLHPIAMAPAQYVKAFDLGISPAGCAHAVHRKLYDLFGPLAESVIAEDVALTFRSLILGHLVVINRKLVKYRLHDSNISIRADYSTRTYSALIRLEAFALGALRMRLLCYDSIAHDCATAQERSFLPPEAVQHIERSATRARNLLNTHIEYLRAGFRGRFTLYSQLKALECPSELLRSLRWRLLPWPIYALMRIAKSNLYALMGK